MDKDVLCVVTKSNHIILWGDIGAVFEGIPCRRSWDSDRVEFKNVDERTYMIEQSSVFKAHKHYTENTHIHWDSPEYKTNNIDS